MAVTRNTATKLWNDVFGASVEWGTDCFGTYIHRDDYGDYDKMRVRPYGTGKQYNYGWDVDHIRPVSNFAKDSDADFWNNYEPMHRSNNSEKSSDYPHFSIDQKRYQVVTCDVCSQRNKKGYGIVDLQTNKRIDWKGVQNRCYV